MPFSLHRYLLGLIFFCLICGVVSSRTSHAPLHAKRQYDPHVDSTIDANAANHTDDFFYFITRPDIHAPRWSIMIYHPEKDLAPGYWYTSVYENFLQHEDENKPWVGPIIYDEDGQLVWSGAPMFNGWNVNNFKVSQVNGVDMLTCTSMRKREVMVIDSSYEMFKEIHTSDDHTGIYTNGHEFTTVANGTRAVALTSSWVPLSDEDTRLIGIDSKDAKANCTAIHMGFNVYDTTTWDLVFQWSSEGKIGVQESFWMHKCTMDHIHGNSIDQFEDGDFLFSGRHTDTVYKISGKDGSIVWRLGGRNTILSDFELEEGLHFSGQHHARVHEQKETHLVISILDNAVRDGDPHITNDQSRGLMLLLQTNTQPMTATTLHTYNHPHNELLQGRGNLEVLSNGNVFAGWSIRSLLSEYTMDETLLMEASLKPNLRTYRVFKFPWVDEPSAPPEVYSAAMRGDNGTTKTAVFVSWNGATEVDSWSLYGTDARGSHTVPLMSEPKQGFETLLLYDNVVNYVIVEALNKTGHPLATSAVIETIPAANELDPSILKDEAWMQHLSKPELEESRPMKTGISWWAFILGFSTCATVVVLISAFGTVSSERQKLKWRRRLPWQTHRYETIVESDESSADSQIPVIHVISDEEKSNFAPPLQKPPSRMPAIDV